jgi:hypothetical protein
MDITRRMYFGKVEWQPAEACCQLAGTNTSRPNLFAAAKVSEHALVDDASLLIPAEMHFYLPIHGAAKVTGRSSPTPSAATSVSMIECTSPTKNSIRGHGKPFRSA